MGQRVARLLAGQGALVRLGSRQVDRSRAVSATIQARLPQARLEPVAAGTASELAAALANIQIVIAAGAAGAVLLPRAVRDAVSTLRVLVDLNAVPPLGIEGVQVSDTGGEQNGVHCYGAIGTGGMKMKIHKAAVKALFAANDLVLDAPEIFQIGREL